MGTARHGGLAAVITIANAQNMTPQEHRTDLQAQQRFLRERLRFIPAAARLTRNSIVDRLEALDEELARLTEVPTNRPAGPPPSLAV